MHHHCLHVFEDTCTIVVIIVPFLNQRSLHLFWNAQYNLRQHSRSWAPLSFGQNWNHYNDGISSSLGVFRFASLHFFISRFCWYCNWNVSNNFPCLLTSCAMTAMSTAVSLSGSNTTNVSKLIKFAFLWIIHMQIFCKLGVQFCIIKHIWLSNSCVKRLSFTTFSFSIYRLQ